MTNITTIFDPPQPTDTQTQFSAKAFGLAAALNPWAAEANALADSVNTDSAAAQVAASQAQNAATAAVGAANYRGDYAAGTTYQVGQSVSYSAKVWTAKTINTGITPVEGTRWTEVKTSSPPFQDPLVLAQVHAIALSF